MNALGQYAECHYEIVFVTSCNNSIGIDLLKAGDEVSLADQLYRSGAAGPTLIDENQEDTKSAFIMQQVLASQGDCVTWNGGCFESSCVFF